MPDKLPKLQSEHHNFLNLDKIKFIIVLVILVNFFTLFFPGFVNSNSRMYASVAKHMALNNDWVNLIYEGRDWLDKPHFPFWMTAISFKIFGVNTFAYVFPGFIFNLIGALFTYKLAFKLYNKNIAWLACLIYLTTLRLIIGTTSVRAEAYLVGEIIPACYYWFLYDKETKLKYLLLGSFFTALVIMTKGLSLTVPVVSGLCAVWLYKKEWKNIFNVKWLPAILLTFLFIAPELVALYIQFDSHPEKIIFGHHHVSGLKFFFWDSQLGRIFNFGPILEHRGYALFFVHTFFWAFLPWCILFATAVYRGVKEFKSNSIINKTNLIYLFSSFFVSFILFSITSFQRDYYTDIIFPFAAIVCAHFLFDFIHNKKYILKLSYLHIILSILFICIAFISFIFVGIKNTNGLLLILPFILIFYMIHNRHNSLYMKGITYPCLSLVTAFLCCQAAIWQSYTKFDPGYNVNHFLSKQENRSVYFYKIDDTTGLYFYSKSPCYWISVIEETKKESKDFYLVTQEEFVPELIEKLPNSKIVYEFNGFQTASFFPLLRQNIKPEFNTKLIVIHVVGIVSK